MVELQNFLNAPSICTITEKTERFGAFFSL